MGARYILSPQDFSDYKRSIKMKLSIWLKKEIYEDLEKVFKDMKQEDIELTFNRAINRVIGKGVKTYQVKTRK